MRMNSKMLVAGLAIMVAGAVAGWSASRLTVARPGVAADSTASVKVQERIAGDLTPRQSYQPAPARHVARVVHQHRILTPRGITIPAGTQVAVGVSQALSSKTAQVGDAWSGTVLDPIFANGREVIPAGSSVRGIVAVATPAERGDRATLQLALRSISIDGRSYAVPGSSESVVAGSPRARNLGAIAGGSAAGALIGQVIGHSPRSTVIGAVLGGGAATAAVAASKGYQATIPAGQQMEFTTGSPVTVRA